jgi:hypothetical protein
MGLIMNKKLLGKISLQFYVSTFLFLNDFFLYLYIQKKIILCV